MKSPDIAAGNTIRPLLVCLFALLFIPAGVRAQPVDWERAYLEAMSTPGSVTRVDAASLRPADVYPLLLMPDSIAVVGELDEIGRKVMEFRGRHPAVASGEHVPLVNNGYVFQRLIDEPRLKDSVVIILGASGRITVNVSRAFPDDSLLRDAVTGGTTFVSFGLAVFDAHETGVLLIEEVE